MQPLKTAASTILGSSVSKDAAYTGVTPETLAGQTIINSGQRSNFFSCNPEFA